MQTPLLPGPAHLAVLRQVATTVAETGKALAAPARFTLVMLVAQAPRTVEALATLTGSSVAIVSHHLAALRRAGLLRAERRGRTAVHHVTDAAWPVLHGLIAFAAETSSELRLGAQAVYAPDAFDVVDPAAGDAAGPLVLDVRAAEEYGNGHHPAARSVPLPALSGALAALPRDRDILCYARGRFCPLSDVAVGLLRHHGFRARRWAVGVVELRSSGRWTPPEPPLDRPPETPA